MCSPQVGFTRQRCPQSLFPHLAKPPLELKLDPEAPAAFMSPGWEKGDEGDRPCCPPSPAQGPVSSTGGDSGRRTRLSRNPGDGCGFPEGCSRW